MNGRMMQEERPEDEENPWDAARTQNTSVLQQPSTKSREVQRPTGEAQRSPSSSSRMEIYSPHSEMDVQASRLLIRIEKLNDGKIRAALRDCLSSDVEEGQIDDVRYLDGILLAALLFSPGNTD
jgi:hypothetical protein